MILYEYINDKTLDENKVNNIKIIGVTGSAGKSSVITLLHKFFIANNINVASFSTIGTYINNDNIQKNNTYSSIATKNALIKFIYQAYLNNCEYIIIELTAENSSQTFWENLPFEIIAITNLIGDHYWHFDSVENYIKAKANYFNNNVKYKIINNFGELADEYSECVPEAQDEIPQLLQYIKNKQNIYYFGNHQTDNLVLEQYSLMQDTFKACLKINKYKDTIYTNLFGKSNIENVLCYLAILDNLALLDFDNYNIINFLQEVTIDGRSELITINERFIFIDTFYEDLAGARTALDYIQNKNPIVVLATGCLGEIEPLLKTYWLNCKNLILTRTFRYSLLLEKCHIKALAHYYRNLGDKVIIEYDRYEAVKKACELSQPGDYIILLGKGTERYHKESQDETNIVWETDKEVAQHYLGE